MGLTGARLHLVSHDSGARELPAHIYLDVNNNGAVTPSLPSTSKCITARRLHRTFRALDKMGRGDLADEMNDAPMASEYKPLTRANERLRDINAEMREVRRSGDSPEDKRHKLDGLSVARNALLKAVVEDSKTAQGER